MLLVSCTSFLAACDSAEKRDGSAASAPSSLTPPKISESFTLLPCPTRPKSTIELEGCAEREILKSDNAINRVAGEIFRRLGTRGARARFVRAEKAWLTYRKATCASRKDLFEGGSASVIVFPDCLVTQNQAHLRDLRTFDQRLRRRSHL